MYMQASMIVLQTIQEFPSRTELAPLHTINSRTINELFWVFDWPCLPEWLGTTAISHLLYILGDSGSILITAQLHVMLQPEIIGQNR